MDMVFAGQGQGSLFCHRMDDPSILPQELQRQLTALEADFRDVLRRFLDVARF